MSRKRSNSMVGDCVDWEKRKKSKVPRTRSNSLDGMSMDAGEKGREESIRDGLVGEGPVDSQPTLSDDGGRGGGSDVDSDENIHPMDTDDEPPDTDPESEDDSYKAMDDESRSSDDSPAANGNYL